MKCFFLIRIKNNRTKNHNTDLYVTQSKICIYTFLFIYKNKYEFLSFKVDILLYIKTVLFMAFVSLYHRSK